MADAPLRRRPGRPRLPPDLQRVSVTLWLRAKDFDRVCRLALEQQISMNGLLRRALNNGFRFNRDAFLE